MLERRQQSRTPHRHRQFAEGGGIELRRGARREENESRGYPAALTDGEIRILDAKMRAFAVDRTKERPCPNFGAVAYGEIRHGSVELFARRGVPGAKVNFVLCAVGAKEREPGRIAMHDPARQVESLAKSRTQPSRADAFATNDGVAFEHECSEARPRRFAGSRRAGRPAADHHQI